MTTDEKTAPRAKDNRATAKKESLSALDRRETTRRHTVFYFRVVDEDSGETVGRLVDLSLTGMKVVSPEPLASGVDLKLLMELPAGAYSRKNLHLPCRLLWITQDVNPSYHVMGLEFDTLHPTDRTVLESLIHEYSFDG